MVQHRRPESPQARGVDEAFQRYDRGERRSIESYRFEERCAQPTLEQRDVFTSVFEVRLHVVGDPSVEAKA
jgi:hypothetical protein